jgi:hypothetical protein
MHSGARLTAVKKVELEGFNKHGLLEGWINAKAVVKQGWSRDESTFSLVRIDFLY